MKGALRLCHGAPRTQPREAAGPELTFAASEMESQFPPERAYSPLPMRARISSAVSSGPLANGVNLREGGVAMSSPLIT